MRGQWVIHENGADKILRVAEQFFEARQRYWNHRFPEQGFDSYRPWMSRQKFGEDLLQQALIAPEGKPFPGPVYLQHYGPIYAESPHLSFAGDRDVKPCPELYRTIPETFAEHRLAYDALVQGPSWLSRLAQRLVMEIVPIAIDGKAYSGLGGVSGPALIGTIFIGKMTEPFARWKAVISLAHELGHQSLMILQTIENMAGDHRDKLVYSGVREVERPFLASLHAAVALAYMLEAGDLLLETQTLDEAERTYLLNLRARHREALRKGHAALAAFDVPPICKEVLLDLSYLAT